MIFETIKRLCKDRNVSIYELEKSCGFTVGTVVKWRNSIPRADRLKMVADYFGVTVEQILEGTA